MGFWGFAVWRLRGLVDRSRLESDTLGRRVLTYDAPQVHNPVFHGIQVQVDGGTFSHVNDVAVGRVWCREERPAFDEFVS